MRVRVSSWFPPAFVRLWAWLFLAALAACSAGKGPISDGGAGQEHPGDAAEAGSDRAADATDATGGGDGAADGSGDLAMDAADAADDAQGSTDVADARAADAGDTCDSDAGVGSLLANGSFEQPLVPAGGYALFTNGDGLSGWTVTGVTGNVAVFSGAFDSDGFSFPAQEGQQLLDLTGVSQTATGVSQTVTTIPGRTYCLSFWVGNVFSPAGGYGSASSVNLLVDGQVVATARNQNGQGQTILSWQRFAMAVNATTVSTTIAFVNGDPANDNSNFIDNVVLR